MRETPKKTIHDESEMTLPQEIQAIAFPFARDMDKIHNLDLPVEEMDISELLWHLDLPFFWKSKEEPFSLRPREVLEHPGQYEYRMNRIMEVDASFPIDIMFWKGKWQILDGLHRLCQFETKGESRVRVRKVPVEWIEKIIPNS